MTASRVPPRCLPVPAVTIALLLGACAALRYTPQETVLEPQVYALTDSLCVIVDLARVPDLARVGGAATIVDERLPRNLLIARPEAARYVVVSSHCTHMGRALSYEHGQRHFRCSSLGHSHFHLDGSVVSGPAAQPLMVYRSAVVGGELHVDMATCCAPGAPCPCPPAAGQENAR